MEDEKPTIVSFLPAGRMPNGFHVYENVEAKRFQQFAPRRLGSDIDYLTDKSLFGVGGATSESSDITSLEAHLLYFFSDTTTCLLNPSVTHSSLVLRHLVFFLLGSFHGCNANSWPLLPLLNRSSDNALPRRINVLRGSSNSMNECSQYQTTVLKLTNALTQQHPSTGTS